MFREHLGQDETDGQMYLYGQLTCIATTQSEVYYIDDDPVVEIYETEFVWEDEKMVAQIKWRKYF